MSNIIAITLGPIYRTTSSVKSTKALWASSYFFSYLAKNFIAPFRKRNFILPIVDHPGLWQNADGIGRFPDRFIFHSQPGDFELLLDTTNKVIRDIAGDITIFLNQYSKSQKVICQDMVTSFLSNYLKIYFFGKECTSDNIVAECNSILDLMELEDSYNMIEEENYLVTFFEHPELRKSFLVEDAFGKNDIRQLFESLDMISKIELDEKHSYQKAYHNYIAIISADGDNMSSTIKALLGKENETGNIPYNGASVQELSKNLLDFGEKTVQLTNQEYKARIVFLGGDDLLIFAPVVYKEKTVFDFVKSISTVFNKEVEKLTPRPTLSFGISINYVKYPMQEAMEIAQNNLELAKSTNEYRNKNSVVFSLQKHSGQTSIGELSKEDNGIFHDFLTLINSYHQKDNKIISSVTYWLANNEAILRILLKQKNNEERISNYFKNSFNESIHHDMNTFYEKLTIFLVKANKVTNNPISLLNTALRFIHFIKSENDE